MKIIPRQSPLHLRLPKWLAAALAIVAVIAAASASARADNYPAKTITIIAPASPGGVTDMLAAAGAALHRRLGRASDCREQARRQ